MRQSSWSVAMRPDRSMRITVASDGDDRSRASHVPENDVWLHFDAKYRVDRLDLPTLELEISAESEEPEDVIDHVAASGTAFDRARYWTQLAHDDPAAARLQRQAGMLRPPQDTAVLLGVVKSGDHLDWIIRERQYNLRADPARRGALAVDSPALAADLVVLYGVESDVAAVFERVGPVVVAGSGDLVASGYPDPGGSTYLCVGVGEALELELPAPASLAALADRLAGPGRIHEPVLATWFDIASIA